MSIKAKKECVQCLFCNFKQCNPSLVKHFKKEKGKDRHSRYVCSGCLDWIDYATKKTEE
jgi:hypothetical protein